MKRWTSMKNGIAAVFFMCLFLSVQGCKGQEETAYRESHTQDVVETAPAIVFQDDKEEDTDIIVNNEAVREPADVPTEEKTEEIREGSQETENTEGSSEEEKEEFYILEINDDIFDRIYGKSFKEDCSLPREDLRYLHVLNRDKDGNTHEGEMIVNKHIAEDVLEIFRELYDNDYPIEKIRLVDEYDADDELSMRDNNSSSFNFRTVPGTKKISKHARGLAIDINTLYNPYIRKVNGETVISPDNATEYADRDMDYDYKIEKGDLCYNLFIEHGFKWGGEWKNSKDYQHFEVPDETISRWYP
jgi:hypothetical protein